MTRRDTWLMLALAAVWGLSFLFLRITSPVVGPLVVAAVRVAGGAVVITACMLWRRTPVPGRHLWGPLLVTALLSAVLPFMGLSYAARFVPAGLLSILNATSPLWGALVAWMWTRETLTGRQWLGLMLGFAGVAALVGSRHATVPGSSDDAPLPPLAIAAALASTLMYALAVHQNKRQLKSLVPLANSWGTLVGAALVLIGPAAWLGPWPDAAHAHTGVPLSWAQVPMVVWGALTGLAVLCTGLAYVWFYDLLDRIGPTRVLTVTYLIPVFGMAWSALLLGEAISGRMLLSALVIVGSTMWAQRGAAR
jgi:drug/metabolite transporter (DMT)-like permease